MQPDTVTANGDPAFSSTGNVVLDLFTQLNRTLTPTDLQRYLEAAWVVSPEFTLKLIAYIRDCRGGLGERRLFYYAALWLRTAHPLAYESNLPIFLNGGRYSDLVLLLTAVKQLAPSTPPSTLAASPEVQLFISALNPPWGSTGPDGPARLAAKWAPSEGGRFTSLVKIFADSLNMTKREYRKFLTQRRAELNLVETALCAGQYDAITFSHVPSQAMLKYRDAFKRTTNVKGQETTDRKQLAKRYAEFLAAVQTGTAKINSGTLMPHQLVAKVMKADVSAADTTVEALWTDMVAKLAATVTPTSYLANAMAIVDTSGSMNCQVGDGISAMHVAIALGLLVTQVSQVAKRQFINFSTVPTLNQLAPGSLKAQVDAMVKSQWNGSTNMDAVFDLLLQLDDPVQHLFIFTDMQFDAACGACEDSTTLFHRVHQKYRAVGRPVPQIVFWNITAKGALPVTVDTNGTAYVSGYSTQVLRAFLSNRPIEPLSIMVELLAKYDVVVPTGVADVTATPVTIDWATVTTALTHPKGPGRPGAPAESSADVDLAV